MSRKTTKRFSVVIKIQLLEEFDQRINWINKKEKSSISRNLAIQATMELLKDIPAKVINKEIEKYPVYDKETLKKLIKKAIKMLPETS